MPVENSGFNLKLLNKHIRMMFPESFPLFLFVLLFSFSTASINIPKTEETKAEGSCVTISCTYKHEKDQNMTLLWFKDPQYDVNKKIFDGTILYSNTDDRPQSPDYSSRVEYITDKTKEDTNFDRTKCDLRINNIQKTDSGNYKFRIFVSGTYKYISEAMTLTVTDNPCKVNIEPSEVKDSVKESDEFTVHCSTSDSCSHHPVWILHKPGQEPERLTFTSTDRIIHNKTAEGKKVTELKINLKWTDDNMIVSCRPAHSEDICLSRNVTLSVEYAPKEVKALVSSEDVKEGDSVSLSCTSRGRPDVTITWFKQEIKNIQSVEWKLHNIKPEDSGQYYCEAENKHGKAKSNIISIDVKYGPKDVSVTPVVNISNLKEGDELKLKCSVRDSNPSVSAFKWYLNESEIKQQTSQILTISKVTAEHKGSYHCKADNGINTVQSKRLQVSVKYSPQIAIVGETSVKVDSRLNLTCSADANPPPNSYTWKHTSTSKMLPKISKRVLNIEKVTVQDAGTYTCDVSNEIGTRDKSIQVDVRYPPSKPMMTMKSDVGEYGVISIICTVQSFPESTLTVTGPFDQKSTDNNQMNRTTSNNKVMMYLKVTQSDAGVYKCTAENSEGINHTEEELLYAPESVTVSTEGEQTAGHDLTLTCNARSEPTPSSYEWKKVINGGIKKTLMKSQKLTFKPLQISDSGQYICTATNIFGEKQSKAVHINVKFSGFDTFLKNMNLTVILSFLMGMSSSAIIFSVVLCFLLFSFSTASNVLLINIPKTEETKAEGSCVTISCTYKPETDQNMTLLWFKDPQYDKKKKIFNGTILYSNTDDRPQSPDYSSRVEYITVKTKEDTNFDWTKCDLRINNIQKTDSGNYNFRIIGSDKHKYMSDAMTLTVIDNPCKVNIEPSEVKDSVKESDEFTVHCSTSDSCSHHPVWILHKPGQEPERLTFTSTDRTIQYKTPEGKKVTELKINLKWTDDNMIVSCRPAQSQDICLSRNVTLSVEYAPKEVKALVSSEDVKEGDSVSLSCTSRGRPDVTIAWFKQQTKNIQSVEWKLHNIKPKDSGQYYCEAENKHGKAKSNIISIDVKYGPKDVSVTPVVNISNLKEGDELKLKCSVRDSNPLVSVFKWYLNESEIKQQTSQTLTISKVTAEHKGSYHCKADNGINTAESKRLQVSVKYSPQIEIVGETSVKVDSRLNLTCSADANPPPNSYTWKHTSTSKMLPKISKRVLNIEKVTVQDAGTYTCYVSNEIGTRDKSVQVDVRYPPSKPMMTMKSDVGEYGVISITCTVQSFPESTLKVTGPFDQKSTDNNQMNRTTSNNKVMMYLKVTQSDAGVYKCTAENLEGINHTEELLYAPKNVTVSTEGELTAGHELTLTCNAQSEPTPSSYEWKKVIRGEKIKTVKSQKLTLKPLQISDSGQYTCTATNIFGEKSQAVHINVKLGSLAVLCQIIFPIILLLILIALIIFLIHRNIIKANNPLSFFLSRSSTESQNNPRGNLSMADVPDPNNGRAVYSETTYQTQDPTGAHVSNARSVSNTKQVYSVITFPQMKQGGSNQQESGDNGSINYATLDFKEKNEPTKRASEVSGLAIYAKVSKKKKSKISEAEQPDYENVSSACAPKLPFTNMDWESDTSDEDEVKYTTVSCTAKPGEPKAKQKNAFDSSSSSSHEDRTVYSDIKP